MLAGDVSPPVVKKVAFVAWRQFKRLYSESAVATRHIRDSNENRGMNPPANFILSRRDRDQIFNHYGFATFNLDLTPSAPLPALLRPIPVDLTPLRIYNASTVQPVF